MPRPIAEFAGQTVVKIPPHAIKVPLPDVQQPETYSCGVASLMSILAYYGEGPDDYWELKDDLNVTYANGAHYTRMAKFAQDLGFHCKVMSEMTLNALDEQLNHRRPVICSIQAYSTLVEVERRPDIYAEHDTNGHFVVAIGLDRSNYYFMDPSQVGRRAYLSRQEFAARWHDNEGTVHKKNIIRHLGMAIWKDQIPVYCATKIG